MASTVKNGNDRLRKGNQRRLAKAIASQRTPEIEHNSITFVLLNGSFRSHQIKKKILTNTVQ